MSDLSRDLAYPFCAVIGYFAATNARETGRLLSIRGHLAVLTIVACVGSLAYSAWASGRVTLAGAGALFDEVQAASVYAPSRSIFPFTQDAPNLGAVAFVLLGALAVPPLLRSPRRLDTTLAGITAVLAVGAGVLTTQSRTGLLALAAASLAYLGLVPRAGGRRHVVVLALVVAGVACGAVISTFPADRSLSAKTDTLQAREQIWGQAFDAFLGEPIVGHGYRYSQVGNFVENASSGGAVTSRLVSTHSEYLSLRRRRDAGRSDLPWDSGSHGGHRSPRDIAAPDSPAGLAYACFLAALLIAMVDSTTSQSAVVASLIWLGFGCTLGLIARADPVASTAWPPLQAHLVRHRVLPAALVADRNIHGSLVSARSASDRAGSDGRARPERERPPQSRWPVRHAPLRRSPLHHPIADVDPAQDLRPRANEHRFTEGRAATGVLAQRDSLAQAAVCSSRDPCTDDDLAEVADVEARTEARGAGQRDPAQSRSPCVRGRRDRPTEARGATASPDSIGETDTRAPPTRPARSGPP